MDSIQIVEGSRVWSVELVSGGRQATLIKGRKPGRDARWQVQSWLTDRVDDIVNPTCGCAGCIVRESFAGPREWACHDCGGHGQLGYRVTLPV